MPGGISPAGARGIDAEGPARPASPARATTREWAAAEGGPWATEAATPTTAGRGITAGTTELGAGW